MVLRTPPLATARPGRESPLADDLPGLFLSRWRRPVEAALIKLENSKARRAQQERITRSRLPKELKDTLQVILSYVGPASLYTLSWVSAETVAETTGVHPRTVERHIHVLHRVGLIKRQMVTVADARRFLKERFNYDLRAANPSTWFLGFSSINKDHPFWQGGDVQQLLADIKKAKHEARVGIAKALEHPVTNDTNIPSPATPIIPSPEGENFPSPVPEKPFNGEEPRRSAPPKPPQEPAAPEQSDAESVRGGSRRQEVPTGSGRGEPSVPRLKAGEGVAESHPLPGKGSQVDSVTHRDSDDSHPEQEEVSASGEETVLDNHPVPVPSGCSPPSEEKDGFLEGDGSLDLILSYLED